MTRIHNYLFSPQNKGFASLTTLILDQNEVRARWILHPALALRCIRPTHTPASHVFSTKERKKTLQALLRLHPASSGICIRVLPCQASPSSVTLHRTMPHVYHTTPPVYRNMPPVHHGAYQMFVLTQCPFIPLNVLVHCCFLYHCCFLMHAVYRWKGLRRCQQCRG